MKTPDEKAIELLHKTYNGNLDEDKECRKCGVVKPISQFYRNKAKKDGYENICKSCHNDRRKEV